MKFIKATSIIALAFIISCNTQKAKDKDSEMQSSPDNQQADAPQHELVGTWVRKDYINAVKNTLTLYEANKKYGKYIELQIKTLDSPDTLLAELADVYGMMPYTLNIYHKNKDKQGKYYASFVGIEPTKFGYLQRQNDEIIFTENHQETIYLKVSDSTSIFRDGIEKILYKVLAKEYIAQGTNSDKKSFKVSLKPNGKIDGFKHYTKYSWNASDKANLDLLCFTNKNEIEYYAVEVTKQQLKLYHLQAGFPRESIITAVPKKQALAYILTRQE